MAPEVVSLPEALRTVVVAAVDPEPLEDAETAKVLGPGAGCMFRRTRESPPILVARAAPDAAAPAAGVMKLHGKLVRLRAEAGADVPALAGGATFAAEGVRMTVRPLAEGEGAVAGVLERSDAELVFELDEGLTVGYRGFYGCDL